MLRLWRAGRGPVAGFAHGMLALCALGLVAGTASAQDLRPTAAELRELEQRAATLEREVIPQRRPQRRSSAAQRFLDGELHYRLRDYERAAIFFLDLVERFPNHRSYPDAVYLLGQSLYHVGEYSGARRRLQEVLSKSAQPGYARRVPGALQRLIQIGLRTGNYQELETYFARAGTVSDPAITYYRAKYLYTRAVPDEDTLDALLSPAASKVGKAAPVSGAASGAKGTAAAGTPTASPLPQLDVTRLQQSLQLFTAVPASSSYAARARYFVGVIHTVQGRFAEAIQAFRSVLRLQVRRRADRKVVALAQLAVGRLSYETDKLDQSVRAYQAISRRSRYFTTALYESAWVHIRRGDVRRSLRALEALSMLAPRSTFAPEASLLHAQILLYDGSYKQAKNQFQGVSKRYAPVARALRRMVAKGKDPRAHFRALVKRNLKLFHSTAFLPAIAAPWARYQGNMRRGVRLVRELARTRRMIEQTEALALRLENALSAHNRVAIYPDLRRHRESTIAMRNRMARMQATLVHAQAARISNPQGELVRVRRERARLEAVIRRMPVDGQGFQQRDARLHARYHALDRVLSRLRVEVLGLEARIVATKRFLAATAEQQRDPKGVQAIDSELDNHAHAAHGYHAVIDNHKRAVEIEELQLGVGDARYQKDAKVRADYLALVQRERALLAAQGRGPTTSERALDRRMRALATRLQKHDTKLERIAETRTAAMRQVLDGEKSKVQGYTTQLESLGGEAEVLVADVAYANYLQVRRRFRNLVLQAEVGKIDVAWAKREAHRMRVEILTQARARELQVLDDEFREIIDEHESQGSVEEE
ncbi:MAG: tetratricopeptide repeat protein [Polyangiales bacterium]